MEYIFLATGSAIAAGVLYGERKTLLATHITPDVDLVKKCNDPFLPKRVASRIRHGKIGKVVLTKHYWQQDRNYWENSRQYRKNLQDNL